jgi:hypothetical protein
MKPPSKIRNFLLRIEPDVADAYGVRLLETNGSKNAPTFRIVYLGARRTQRILPQLVAAVKASHQRPTVLGPQRNAPITLEEAAGVRLALILLATRPLVKWQRVERIAAGIDGMTIEETYYWYAKCVGSDARRAQRSLRLLLAEE